MTKKLKTITVTNDIIEKLNDAIKISLEFEDLTQKQMNITSIVGEVLTCNKHNLELVIDDINAGFDALDKEGKRVQIKTRRFKGVKTAMTGTLLDKNFTVPFDYAILVLLNEKYEFIEDYFISSDSIVDHFERINNNRLNIGKQKRKNMSISQFIALANGQKRMASS